MSAHIPIGYKVENGVPVVDDEKATAVRNLFIFYISGYSLNNAAREAGLKVFHARAGKILRDKRYLGKGIYPKLIDEAIFNAAEDERNRRAVSLGRIFPDKEKQIAIPTHFVMDKVDVPAGLILMEKAAYLYSSIRSE